MGCVQAFFADVQAGRPLVSRLANRPWRSKPETCLAGQPVPAATLGAVPGWLDSAAREAAHTPSATTGRAGSRLTMDRT